MSVDWTEIFDNEWEPKKEEFPEYYELQNEIKSPLNVLWYNMNYEFLDKYPAKMSSEFATDMIKIYSKKGDLVWDGCCGSGVIPRAAARLQRQPLGTDINPKAIDLCLKHKAETRTIGDEYHVADVKTHDFNGGNYFDLILSSFPFGLNIIGDKNRYSEKNEDLSNSKNFESFFQGIKLAIQNYYKQLKPAGIMILDARDRTKEGRYIDVINYFRNFAIDCGFKMVCRYTYFLMPWSHYTFFNKPSGKAVPMISTMDAIVMCKPDIEPLG